MSSQNSAHTRPPTSGYGEMKYASIWNSATWMKWQLFFFGVKTGDILVISCEWKKTGVWSLVEKQVRSSERSSNLGFKSNFPKNTGLTSIFQVRRLYTSLTGKIHHFVHLVLWGRWEQATAALLHSKSLCSLIRVYNPFLPCPVSKELF